MKKQKVSIVLLVLALFGLSAFLLAQDKPIKTVIPKLQKERVEFKSLIAVNPNYFGTLLDKKLQEKYKPVFPMKANVSYEELKCVGLYPESDVLEAVVEVKLPYGFSGGLCQEGSTEFVSFYIDYQDGAGFQSVGDPATVNVHDISAVNGKHLYYAVRKSFVPTKLLACANPQIVTVRAILSWQAPPTSPDFIPVWGNRLDQYVQIRPKSMGIVVFPPEYLKKYVDPGIKFPPFEAAEFPPKPIPPEEYVVYGNLQQIKNWASAQEQAEKVEPDARVEPERLKMVDLLQKNPNHFGSISPSKDPQQLLMAVEKLPKKAALYWKEQLTINPDILQALQAYFLKTKYEELRCLGLYPEEDLLEAVIEVKLPYGFCGDLCKKGSKEYVAFYIDWGDGAGYAYAATAQVKVHDIPDVAPDKHLFYAVKAKIPGIDSRLKACSQENIVRVKAVLSWNYDPTPYGPGYSPVYGNSLVRDVQIRPKDGLSVAVKITTVNGIPDFHICQSGGEEGYALKEGTVAAPYEFDRPFGGIVACSGQVQVAGAAYYRFLYSEDMTNWFPIVDKRVTPNPILWGLPYILRTPDADGWFDVALYLQDRDVYSESHLVYWRTNGKDGKYYLKLEVANASKTVIGQDVITLQLDNTAPAMYSFSGTNPLFPQTGVAIKDAADQYMKCEAFQGPAEIRVYGNFYDKHFKACSLIVFGGNISSSGVNFFSRSYDSPIAGVLNDTGTVGAAANSAGQNLTTLNLCNIAQVPAKVKCAYGIRLVVSDRTIYGYLVNGYELWKTWFTANAYVTFDWDPAGCL
jgi:hypothetical protein